MSTKPKISAAMLRMSKAHDHMASILLNPRQHCLCDSRLAFKELDSASVALFREYVALRETCKAYGIEVPK